MTKNDVIRTTLWAMRQDRGLPTGVEVGNDDWDNYEAIVIATLKERLLDRHFATCSDLGDLGVQCCHTCHAFYPHYEMHIEDLPNSDKAWICCFVRSALRGEKALAGEDLEEFIDLEVALGGGIRKVEQAIQENDEEKN